MSQSGDYILLGKISGVHGIKGWVKVFSYTSPRIKITEYKQWFLKSNALGSNAVDSNKESSSVAKPASHVSLKDQSWSAIKLIEGKEQGKNIIAKLQGVNYRDEAEALIGTEIAICEEQLQVLTENEYFWRDLIGLSVKTIQGDTLGVIDWIFDTGSNDVIIVKDTSGSEVKEHLLPWVFDDVIQSIDLENSLMVVDWDPDF